MADDYYDRVDGDNVKQLRVIALDAPYLASADLVKDDQFYSRVVSKCLWRR